MGGESKSEISKDEAVKGLAEALKALVEKITQITPSPASPTKKSALPDWVNSPFIITFLGGLLISGTTLAFQYLQTQSAQKIALRQARQEAIKRHFEQELVDRKNAMMEFINQFPAAEVHLYEYKYCHAWVIENAATTTVVDYAGRNYAEMLKRADVLNTERVASRMADSFPAQIEATFTNSEVLNLADTLHTQLGELFDAKKVEDAEVANDKMDLTYDKLMKAMGAEVKFLQQTELKEFYVK